MIEFYKYILKTIDPIFYALEGVSGAYTPPYLHSTAINFAVASSLNINSDQQPYVIADNNGGKNTPRYKNSIASDLFYFTPAKFIGNIDYYGEIVKADGDAFVSLGYGSSTGKAERLKASKLFSIAPETKFYGYLYKKEEISKLPNIIRLGSFRGIVEVEYKRIKVCEVNKTKIIDHPVDPLVTTAKKGFMVNILPYPIVDNVETKNVLEVKGSKGKQFISLPVKLPKIEKIRANSSDVII